MSNAVSKPSHDTADVAVRFGMRLTRALLLCREVLLRAWRDPALGPDLRRLVLWQSLGVVLLAAVILWLGIGIHQAASDAPLSSRIVALITSGWGAALTAHWSVIALSYSFHDQITRRASMLVGLWPEDPDRVPRVRLDLRWIKKRLSRRIRGFTVMLPGFIAFAALSAVLGRWVSTILGALWLAHWWLVFSLAKSARAWPEPAIAAPWYLRQWDALAASVPLLQHAPFRWWRNYLSKSSTSVWAPLSWSERLPAEGMALSLMRLGANAPGLGMALRPLVPLCAALVLEHGDGALDFLRSSAGAGGASAPFPGASPTLLARADARTHPEPPREPPVEL